MINYQLLKSYNLLNYINSTQATHAFKQSLKLGNYQIYLLWNEESGRFVDLSFSGEFAEPWDKILDIALTNFKGKTKLEIESLALNDLLLNGESIISDDSLIVKNQTKELIWLIKVIATLSLETKKQNCKFYDHGKWGDFQDQPYAVQLEFLEDISAEVFKNSFEVVDFEYPKLRVKTNEELSTIESKLKEHFSCDFQITT